MEIIKFRAWDKANKRMYEPFLLAELFHSHNHSLGGDYRADLEDMEFKYRTIGLDFMQFTGLLDKNGKEIYEGDICTDINDDIYEVKLDEAAFVVVLGGNVIEPLSEDYKDLEIIGNIYENPELRN